MSLFNLFEPLSRSEVVVVKSILVNYTYEREYSKKMHILMAEQLLRTSAAGTDYNANSKHKYEDGKQAVIWDLELLKRD